MASVYLHNQFVLLHAAGATPVDWVNDDIRVLLVTDTHTPDTAVEDYWDDVSANEVADGDGYTTGGQSISNIAVTLNTGVSPRRAEVDGDDVTWTFTADVSFRFAYFVKWTGVASSSLLIGYIDYGAGGRTENGTFVVQHPASGFFHYPVAAGQ